MTRINCVPPFELVDKHLLAEYRELPRIFSLVENRVKSGQTAHRINNDIPVSYRMGAGHVSFFFNKLEFLRRRHGELVAEMKRRGWKPLIDCSDRSLDLDSALQLDWQPDEVAMTINRERIKERLS